MDLAFRSNDLFLISQNNGKQTFIFYTLGGKSLGMVEVLINGELENDKDQLVIDYGDLGFWAGDKDNTGDMRLGGGDNKLVTLFTKFTMIKAYTMCAYNQVVSGTDC